MLCKDTPFVVISLSLYEVGPLRDSACAGLCEESLEDMFNSTVAFYCMVWTCM